MKNVGYRMETFSPFDLQGTEEHLSAMAAKGWRLESIGRFLWKYRRTEPAHIHYAVTCPPAAGENGDIGERLYFEELCAAAGWEKVTDWAELQVYANPASAPTPLETDETLRLESVHQSMRRTYLTNCRNNMGCNFVLLITRLAELFLLPQSFFLSSISLGTTLVCLVLIATNLTAMAAYHRWHRRSLQSVEEGGGLAPVPRSYRLLSWLPTAVLTLLILSIIPAGLLTLSPRDMLYSSVVLSMVLLAAVLLGICNHFLKRRNLDWRNLDWQTRAAAGILLSLALLAAMTGLWDHLDLSARFYPSSAPPSYTWDSREWDLEPQPLPLTVADLTGEDWPHVRRRAYPMGHTLFASKTDYYESACQEGGRKAYLSYGVLDARPGWVYRRILEHIIQDSESYQYQPENPALWGAEAVYHQYFQDEAKTHWILCWPGRVVRVFGEGLGFTPEQKAVIGARLAPKAGEEATQ